MRRRYFSPQLRETLQIYKSKQPSKLRWVGSQVRLASPSHFDEQPEQSIGPYTYQGTKQIGSGYSSKVYKARKFNDPTDYAIKVIDLKKYSSTNMEMLTNEIQILKGLNHPNVLKCYDVYRTATQCFIVTEFCPHGDLLGHLAKKGRLGVKDALDIVADVVEGYKYLCEQSIIHRDLKPANILRTGNRWKIADFGFAIKSDSEIRTKYNVGTPLYMPPQALIENLYSVKSDIFSIGIILYELLVGCTPWESRTEKDLIKKMAAVPFRIPEKYEIPAGVKSILQSMCEVKEKKRLDKPQLLSLSLSTLYSPPNPEHLPSPRPQKSPQPLLNLRLNHKSIQPPKLVRLISSKSILEAQEDVQSRKKQAYNNEILICQLHYCRFLYYLVRNIGCFGLERRLGQKLGVVVFTHLMKLVKMIGDGSKNGLNLKDWEKFKKSKKYQNTSLTIKQYIVRYQKQYLLYLKQIQLPVLEQTNQLFLELSRSPTFTPDFYSKLQKFIQPILRTCLHNLSLKLLKKEGEIGREEAGQIEALRCLWKYYGMLAICGTRFQDFQYFQSQCNVKVTVDFRKSGATLEDFHELRKELKNI